MPRIQIDLPETFLFTTTIPLHMSHMNWGGHLDSAQTLVIVSEARERFFGHMGYTQRSLEGLVLVMRAAAECYLAEGFYGDVMAIDVTFGEWHAKGFDVMWRMRNRDTGVEVARGVTAMLFFDPAKNCATEIPEAFVTTVRNMGWDTRAESGAI